MITPERGQIVKMRSGDLVRVDQVASQILDDYRWYAEDGQTINAELPVETIFIGTAVRLNVAPPHNVAQERGTVVSDFSEIVSVIA